ncbi:MAG: hypothetical protein IKC13_06740 [Elusimicrobiaceae bacterium]|nr:hypothetical protein [Elusimicrobiaceae bacterium]
MKVWNYLKSCTGAISKAGALGLTATLGLVGLNVYNFVMDRPAVEEKAVRSLSQIMASGGDIPAEYTGINISADGVEFATAEEIAKREGTFLDGGNAAVDAINAFGGPGVKGQVFTEGGEGLGLGANKALRVNADGTPVDGGANADPAAVAAAARAGAAATKAGAENGAEGGTAGNAANGPTLSRATIARASGSNLGSGTMFGGTNTSSNGGAGNKANTNVGAKSISGAMREGSTFLQVSDSLKGTTAASYKPSKSVQKPKPQKGRLVDVGLSNDLRGIAKDMGTIKLAAMQGRTTLGGPQKVYMNSKNLTFAEDGFADGSIVPTKSSGEGTPDPSTPDGLDEMEEDLMEGTEDLGLQEAERKKERNGLRTALLSLLGATLVSMVAISACMQSPEPWGKAVGWALAGVMYACIAALLVSSILYAVKWKAANDGWVIGSWVGVAAMIAGITLAAVGQGFQKKVNKAIESVMEWLEGGIGEKGAKAVSGAALGVGGNQLLKGGKAGVNQFMDVVNTTSDGSLTNTGAENAENAGK